MTFDRFAGMASVVGLILITMIALDLSKWQPLAAALIALGGGILAYSGAMAKVELDRKSAERAVGSRKLGVFLRLQASLRKMIIDVERVRNTVGLPFTYTDGTLPESFFDQLRFYVPPEFEEVWSALELFPPKLIDSFFVLRENSKIYEVAEADITSGRKERLSRENLRTYEKICDRMLSLARELVKGLEVEIQEILASSNSE